jgi:hypothetical protein
MDESNPPTAVGSNAGLGARWIAWSGGRCPLEAGIKCETQHRDGSVTKDRRVYSRDRWDHLGVPCDIVAYRVVG